MKKEINVKKMLVILILLMLPVTVYGQLRGVNTKGQFANDAYCYDVSFANIHEAIDTAAAWNATLYITQTNTMSYARIFWGDAWVRPAPHPETE